MIILSTHKTGGEFKTGRFVMRVNRDEKHLHNF